MTQLDVVYRYGAAPTEQGNAGAFEGAGCVWGEAAGVQ